MHRADKLPNRYNTAYLSANPAITLKKDFVDENNSTKLRKERCTMKSIASRDTLTRI